jgi:hypothetical protein
MRRLRHTAARHRESALPAAFYILLTLLIIGPWLRPGFVLSLDMVFGPFEPTPIDEFYGFDVPALGAKQSLETIYSGLSDVIGGDWAQKTLLGLIFLSAGLGAHLLPPVRRSAPRYVAGTLYVVNPFVYARLLAGQWFVLAAYACIPLAIWSFQGALERPTLRRIIIAAFLISLTSFNAQMFVLAAGILASLTLARAAQDRSPRPLAVAGPVAAIVAMFNLYWIVPALTADNSLLQMIDDRDLIAFAPVSQFGNISVSVLGMYGFWRDAYEYPVDKLAGLFFLIIVFIWLAAYGLLTRWRQPLVAVSGALFIVGFVLATGIAGPFSWLFRFLSDNLPLFDGFRDSQKFVALIVLAYAVMSAVGVEEIASRIGGKAGRRRPSEQVATVSFAAVAVAIALAYTFTQLWGFGGRLRPVEYPADWAQARQILDAGAGDSSVLLLPWDTYTEYEWVPNQEKSVRTLAKAYFSQRLIYPKYVIKLAGIFGQSNSPEQQRIRDLLNDAPLRTDFGARIAPLNAEYVLISKSGDWDQHEYLESQQDLELALDGPNIRLYRSLAPSARASAASGGTVALELERLSPVRYRLRAEPAQAEVRFVAPNGSIDGWRLDGAGPVDTSEGFAGTFVSDGDGFFEYHPASITVRWTVTSAFAALIAAVLLFGAPARLVERTWARWRLPTALKDT